MKPEHLKEHTHFRNARGQVRRILGLAGTEVHFLDPIQMTVATASRSAFARWAKDELPADEPARPDAMAFHIYDRPVFFVFKYRFHCQFHYSLNPHAIYAEQPPAGPDDWKHQFDVRDLPAELTRDLRIEGSFLNRELWRTETMRERNAHLVAIALAFREGIDPCAVSAQAWGLSA